jgi:hypothetical protein
MNTYIYSYTYIDIYIYIYSYIFIFIYIYIYMYIYVYIQVKGALAVLDCLFLHHLRNAGKKEKFRVHADGPLSSACRHAATIYVSSSYCLCVLVLLYMCPHATICVSSCFYICVLILLYVCPHTAICVSSYCYICVLILLYIYVQARWRMLTYADEC